MELDLIIVSKEDVYNCYHNSDEKPFHTNIEDEVQVLPKEINFTSETGIKSEHIYNEPHQPVRKKKKISHTQEK